MSRVTFFRRFKSRNAILLYMAAEERAQWWGTTRELAELAGVSFRRAQHELGKLVAEGWLECEEKGPRNSCVRMVRYRPRTAIDPIAVKRVHCDRSDRSTAIDPIAVLLMDRARARPRLRIRIFLICTVRPSGRGSGRGRTHGRRFRARQKSRRGQPFSPPTCAGPTWSG